MVRYAASLDDPTQVYRRDGFHYALWNHRTGSWCPTCYDASLYFFGEENAIPLAAEEVEEYIRTHTPADSKQG